jgi:hypothetical protein
MAVGVAGVLGMPADFHNVGHLMGLLAAHTQAAVYPKMKFRGTEHRIVHSTEEELELGDEWTDERGGGTR